MLFVVLPSHLQTSLLEDLPATFRPSTSSSHHAGQEIEGQRVREKAIDTLLTGRCDEILGVVDVRTAIQDPNDVRIRQGVEAKYHHLGVWRYVLQVLPIVRTKPVCLST